MKVHFGELTLTSSAFKHGAGLPDDYSSNGAGATPPLSWSNVPAGTKSFAIVVQDLDAPMTYGFTHWVLYGIPGDARELPAGGGAAYTQGLNGMEQEGWVPASPPPGHGTHFYYFHLYALDEVLELESGLTLTALQAAIDEHIIEQARIVATYSN